MITLPADVSVLVGIVLTFGIYGVIFVVNQTKKDR